MTAIRVATDDRNHVHTQSVPAASVVVTHNLGKYTAVTVVDTSMREIDCDVEHLNLNQTRITHTSAFSWIATFN